MWPSLACLCLAAALALPGPVRGAVVRQADAAGFADCDAFFYQRTPPDGLRPGGPPALQKICQKYKQEPRFATLYSTQDKIPLYSAFRCAGGAAAAAPSGVETWLVEPQVSLRG
uniref:Uncharacterized protein n=1 Tax=Varanus komodoensis TaxID=61221 RepID=A0A8D2KXE7_VARKO